MTNLEQQLIETGDSIYDSLGGFYIKGLHGNYLYLNNYIASHGGFAGVDDLLGKTDFDTPWEEQASALQENDRLALHSPEGIQRYEVIGNCFGTHKIYISHKKPFYHQDKLAGIFGSSLEVPVSALNNSAPLTETTEFVDIQREQLLTLTKRQKQTLYWLLRGNSAKETADRLHISHRTVEHHIESIKANNEYKSIKELLLQVRFV